MSDYQAAMNEQRCLSDTIREWQAHVEALTRQLQHVTSERDAARAEVKHWRDAGAAAQVKLDTRPDVEAERLRHKRLYALLCEAIDCVDRPATRRRLRDRLGDILETP